VNWFNSFKEKWLKLKRSLGKADHIETTETEIRWAKARLSLKNNAEFQNLQGWLDFLVYQYVEQGISTALVDPVRCVQHFAKAEAVWKITKAISEETIEKIKIQEENLDIERNR
jgi:hypothetical protein